VIIHILFLAEVVATRAAVVVEVPCTFVAPIQDAPARIRARGGSSDDAM
jgi:hypothetical protein